MVHELERLRVEVADLRASRKRLAVADDGERRSIERDLHDGVQQHLVAFSVSLQSAAGLADTDPGAVKAMLDELGHDVQLALEEARKLAHRVYPPLLEAGGLAAALRMAAVRANVPTRIDIEAQGPYPPGVARAVYVCWIEVLERVAAGAQAAVTVRDENRTVAFQVVADCADPDLKLDRLRDRIEALGGQLTIKSQAGGAIRVAGSIPLSE